MISWAQRVLGYLVRLELALSRSQLVIVDEDLARFFDRAHHCHLFASLREMDIAEANVKQSTELVAIARIAPAVIELQPALAVLFYRQFPCADNAVSI